MYNISKIDVSEENIHQIAGKINFNGLTDSEVKKMYKELDTNKDGRVSIDEFISGIIEVSSLQRSSKFKDFFDRINMSITSKSQMILDKLKTLKETVTLANDKTSIEHIEWITKTIIEEDIYEPIIELDDIHNEKNAIDVVQVYSNKSNMTEKKNDVMKVQDNILKKITTSAMSFKHLSTTTINFFRQNSKIEVSPFE
jgi:hypothetical protein